MGFRQIRIPARKSISFLFDDIVPKTSDYLSLVRYYECAWTKSPSGTLLCYLKDLNYIPIAKGIDCEQHTDRESHWLAQNTFVSVVSRKLDFRYVDIC